MSNLTPEQQASYDTALAWVYKPLTEPISIAETMTRLVSLLHVIDQLLWQIDALAADNARLTARVAELERALADRELPPAQTPAMNGSAPIPRAVGSTDAPPAVPTPGIPTHTWKLNKRQMETLRTIGDAPEGWGYAGRYGEINGNVAKALMRRGLVKYAYEWDHKTFEITEAGRAALADGSR